MQRLTGDWYQRTLACGMAKLDEQKGRVNALNVFPVPDGDTGSNLAWTIAAASDAAAAVQGPLGDVAAAGARGALLGARGNSGVILSQWLRGIAEGFEGLDDAGAEALVKAFVRADAVARAAVLDPVEGTMLTIARACAEAARERLDRNGSLADVMCAAHRAAGRALAVTPQMLDVLKQAGVVDAGGQGLVYILEGALAACGLLDGAPQLTPRPVGAAPPARTAPHHGAISVQEITFKYCTEFLVKGEFLEAAKLRGSLEPLGDSLLVVGDPTCVKVHLHTNEPWTALRLCGNGRDLVDVHVHNMVEQNRAAAQPEEGGPQAPADDGQAARSGVVAIVQGDGFKRILRELGVTAFVDGGQSMNPSTEEILASVRDVPAGEVLVLPNDKNCIETARQAASLCDRPVHVVSTHTQAHGVAAMVCFTPEEDAQTLAKKMGQAQASVRVGQVTTAMRSASMNGCCVHAGEVIGFASGGVQARGGDAESVAEDLVYVLLKDGGEIVTLYTGEGADPGRAAALHERIQVRRPDIEVELYEGRQRLYPYVIAVE